ncbi:hypothetical protein HZS_6859 [Henneguya salminicola]|nr:hypothetical protein HZS_6859 [Henneguya salminicola]
MLRAECSSGTEFGKRIKETIDAGNLVSDDIMLKLIAAFIQRHVDINGYLFDGFPRTEIQAHGVCAVLADILKDHNLNVNKVFKFDVMKDMLIERAVGRLIHPASGRVYHAKNYPPKIANCDDVFAFLTY